MTMSKNKNNQETQKQGAMPEEEKKDMNSSNAGERSKRNPGRHPG